MVEIRIIIKKITIYTVADFSTCPLHVKKIIGCPLVPLHIINYDDVPSRARIRQTEKTCALFFFSPLPFKLSESATVYIYSTQKEN